MNQDPFPFSHDAEEQRIRVLIADDLKFVRDVIRLYLERAEDMSVVGEASDLDAALEKARSSRPDIVIMNGDLPPIDCAHATAIFRQNGFTAPILIVTMKLEPSLMKRSFLQGANGFMHKDEIDDYLVEAVRRVHHGERYLSSQAAVVYSSVKE
jgi:two-component system invasion response regulator UvrY